MTVFVGDVVFAIWIVGILLLVLLPGDPFR